MQTGKDCRRVFIEGFSQMSMYDTYAEDFSIKEDIKKAAERERQKYMRARGESFNLFSIYSFYFLYLIIKIIRTD